MNNFSLILSEKKSMMKRLKCWKRLIRRNRIKVSSRLKKAILILEKAHKMLIYVKVSTPNVVSRVANFPVDRNRELPSQELFLENQRSFFLMRPLLLWMKIPRRRSRRLSKMPCKVELPLSLLTE